MGKKFGKKRDSDEDTKGIKKRKKGVTDEDTKEIIPS
jgi:hypothetical protein